MKPDNLSVCVLAAGKGTRMGGDIPKVLVPLEGKPLLGYVLSAIDTAGIASGNVVVVVGHQYERVVDFLDESYPWVLQSQQQGTGHAVMCAGEKLDGCKTVMVLYGDVPLITSDIISGLQTSHLDGDAVCTVLTADIENPFGYGRIVRDSEGNVTDIVEEKEADEETRKITEINTGLYCFEREELFNALDRIGNDNAKGEYYLTDVVRVFIDQGLRVNAVVTDDCARVLGINTPGELEHASTVIKGN